jgi:hypothetical protein
VEAASSDSEVVAARVRVDSDGAAAVAKAAKAAVREVVKRGEAAREALVAREMVKTGETEGVVETEVETDNNRRLGKAFLRRSMLDGSCVRCSCG